MIARKEQKYSCKKTKNSKARKNFNSCIENQKSKISNNYVV